MHHLLRPSARVACALALLSCALPGAAKRATDKSFLELEDRVAMTGKTFVVALHHEPAHTKFDDGSFWASGLSPAIGIRNARMDGMAKRREYGSLDPTPVADVLLADVLRDVFGMQQVDVGDRIALNTKPRYLAAFYPEAQYVLSVSTSGTLHGEWLTGKGGRVAIAMNLQLVDVATQHTVASYGCNENTKERDGDPTMAELEANDGQRIKQTLQVLAATCARKFTQRLGVPDDKLLAFPKWNQNAFEPWSPPALQAATPEAASGSGS